MSVAISVSLIVAGVLFPMAVLAWLGGRLNRQPTLRSLQVGLLLALNGTLPVALIMAGIGLLTSRLGTNVFFTAVTGVSAVATVAIAAGLWWEARRSRPDRTEP